MRQGCDGGQKTKRTRITVEVEFLLRSLPVDLLNIDWLQCRHSFQYDRYIINDEDCENLAIIWLWSDVNGPDLPYFLLLEEGSLTTVTILMQDLLWLLSSEKIRYLSQLFMKNCISLLMHSRESEFGLAFRQSSFNHCTTHRLRI